MASARRINGGHTRAIVNVIGFNLPSSEAAKLRTVAQAGGGAFVNVSNQTELDRVTAQVRESIRRTDNAVATSLATTDNDVATSLAITDADTCVSNLTTDEDVAMSLDLTDRAVRGQRVPFQEEAKALLKARHDALRARLQAYRAQLTGAEAAAKKRIDAAADAAR
ncbi:hypothetical protein VZ52_00120 [Ralstonia mannitolilytica]|nr:hypothetical protein VZ52_00120 [Ralstonia mannitolilytica]